jgi:cytochrome b6-f complex iron-sulfur subunit
MNDSPRPFAGSLSRRTFMYEALAAVGAFVVVGCTSSKKKTISPRPTTTTRAATSTSTGTSTSTSTSQPVEPGFGGRIDAGAFDRVRAAITNQNAPYYVPEARAYVSAFPSELLDRARAVYPKPTLPALDAGLVVLYQRCTHLGCRVPFCASSQWFECPCHDAKFDRVGEQRQGVAPRGMDHIAASVVNGRLVIDTGKIVKGLPVGTNTTNQRPDGPFCV